MIPATIAAIAAFLVNLTLSLKPGCLAVRLCRQCRTPYIGTAMYGGCWRCG